MLNQPCSNLNLVDAEFRDLFLFPPEEHDETDKSTTRLTGRRTYKFDHNLMLSVTEQYNEKGEFCYYQYNLYKGKKPLLKFHSESHDDEAYQTATEPYHIHKHDGTRMENYRYQTLPEVMGLIRMMLLLLDAL